jgi:hypothetical protein
LFCVGFTFLFCFGKTKQVHSSIRHFSFFKMAVLGKFAKQWRQKAMKKGVPNWKPAPHIELDDELREYCEEKCASHITPAAVDLDLFTCVDVDKKSCH